MDYKEKYEAIVGWLKKYADEGMNITPSDIRISVPELSESEDERIRKDIINLIEFALKDGSAVAPGSRTTKEEALAYLEKQKEQKPNIELIQRSWYMEGYHDREFSREPKWIIKTGEGGPKYEENEKYGQPLEQKPAEWSEDELDAIEQAIMALEQRYDPANNGFVGHKLTFHEAALALKSLRPQPYWKPSEEQMIYLKEAINKFDFCDAENAGLQALYEQLKKL